MPTRIRGRLGSDPDFRESPHLRASECAPDRTHGALNRDEVPIMVSVMRLFALFIAATIFVAADGLGQTPQPFPRPGDAAQTPRPAAPPAQPQRPVPAPAAAPPPKTVSPT